MLSLFIVEAQHHVVMEAGDGMESSPTTSFRVNRQFSSCSAAISLSSVCAMSHLFSKEAFCSDGRRPLFQVSLDPYLANQFHPLSTSFIKRSTILHSIICHANLATEIFQEFLLHCIVLTIVVLTYVLNVVCNEIGDF